MFTPIHRELGFPPGELTLSILEQAIDNRVEETIDLDWKRSLYNHRQPGWADEAAKDIAAMANSGGGWIFFGVAENPENNAAAGISPIHWNSDIEQRMLRVSYAKIGPPVLGIQFFPIPVTDSANGGFVVAMRVPDSHDAPHFAKKGNDAFVAPRRNGPHTVFMSDREIERGFRERFQYADDQKRLLQDRFVEASEMLNSKDGVFLAIAAIPLEPAFSLAPPTEDDICRIVDQPLNPELIYSEKSRHLWDNGNIKKGMRRWILRSFPSYRMKFCKEFFDDGTLLSGYQLGLLIEEGSNRYHPSGCTNHCLSAHIEWTLIDFVSLLQCYAASRQSHGGYRIRAGLIGASGDPIYIRTTAQMGNYLLDLDFSEPIGRFQPVSSGFDPLSPVSEFLPAITDLALDLVNQGGVRNLRIMMEPKDLLENA